VLPFGLHHISGTAVILTPHFEWPLTRLSGRSKLAWDCFRSMGAVKMRVQCPTCGTTVGEQIGGKLGVAAAGALLGSRMNPAAAIFFGLLGAVAGHVLIDQRMRICPRCGTFLRIIGELPI